MREGEAKLNRHYGGWGCAKWIYWVGLSDILLCVQTQYIRIDNYNLQSKWAVIFFSNCK